MLGKSGASLLQDSRFNRSTAFSEAERDLLGITGLLPPGVDTMQTQLQRVRLQLDAKTTDIERYIFLNQLHDSMERVYYALLMSDPARFLPLVYTPTVGEACQRFGHILRRPRGMYITAGHRGRIRELLRNWPYRDVRFIVVTNGERVLGLGDLGANGMGIPIGKLALYTAVGGVPPELTLPVMLDCGTNTSSLLDDPLYLGLRQGRVTPAELDGLVEEFMTAADEVFPGCCVQFEDWAGVDALRFLARYQGRMCTFNDDIQGTAAVALAGILGALRITGGTLTSQRILFLGAGSAGCGIARMLTLAMVQAGASEAEARARCHLYDRGGLITAERADITDFQRPFAHPHPPVASFVQAVAQLRPTVIIGVSATPHSFNQAVVEEMARINPRPIIFPYSNPTSRSECTAEQAYTWSRGTCVFASGSPFPPVRIGRQIYVPGQGNNVYIFPGLAMGVLASGARRISDAMLLAAARQVAAETTDADRRVGLVYPPQARLLETELAVAHCVAEVAFESKLARQPRPANLEAHIRELTYDPSYTPLA